MVKKYVQYGCGLCAPNEWINYDVSPTLRIQQTPLLGKLLKRRLNTEFPNNVIYGDIIKGLPVSDNSCDGLYCSHTLEHLALDDFRIALHNSYKILKKGGIFRCVVPDLEKAARKYLSELENGNKGASLNFIGRETLLGVKSRPKGVKGFLIAFFGNSHHLWMWDYQSLSQELLNAGFSQVRKAKFGDCDDSMFKYVEESGRFIDAVAIECKK